MNWRNIESMEDLQTAIDLSNEKTVVLFKHSTRCPVSSMARRVLESQWSFDASVVAYHLDLIRYRELSDFVATHFNIRHESPQMIVIKGEKPVHHASHMNISTDILRALA